MSRTLGNRDRLGRNQTALTGWIVNIQIAVTVKRSLFSLAVAALLTLGGGGEAMAGTGASLFISNGCVTCHGPAGKKPIIGAYPKLAGQNADYLIAQIKAFKSGARKGALSALMANQAALVSEAEMKKIACISQR